jgi:hypothetical protein
MKLILTIATALSSLYLHAQNIGINVANPQFPLHIVQTASGTALNLQTAVNGDVGQLTTLRFTNTVNSGNGLYSSAISGGRSLNGSTYLSFATSRDQNSTPSENMRIDNLGNVGIGIAGPEARLDVRTNAAVIASFRSTGATAKIFVMNNDIVAELGTNSEGGFAGTLNSSPFLVRTGSITRMYFSNTTGYVGINTTAPAERLHVNGNIRVEGEVIQENKTEVFTSPVFWGNFGGGYENVTYYRDKMGRVHIEGVAVTLLPVIYGQVMFTLPVGYRPGARLVFGCMTPSGLTRVEVWPTGEVVTFHSFGLTAWLSLSGISFVAN